MRASRLTPRVVAEPLDVDEVELADEGIPLEELSTLRSPEAALREVAEQTAYGEILLEDLIRRQLVLSLSVAAVYLVILFGLPLVSLLIPEVMAVAVFGLPLGWLLLAVLIYPALWALAKYFASTSKQYEDEFAKLVR